MRRIRVSAGNLARTEPGASSTLKAQAFVRSGGPPAGPDGRRGFTLIELLVVIAIISLLVSILMPSLYQAKEMAANVQCQMNLHNLALTMAQYVLDYDDKLLGGRYRYWIGSTEYVLAWGRIFQHNGYIDQWGFWHCPSAPLPGWARDDPPRYETDATHTYGLREHVDGSIPYLPIEINWLWGRIPADYPLVADSIMNWGWGWAEGYTIDYNNGMVDDTRHMRSTNLIYADWHVETRDAAGLDDMSASDIDFHNYYSMLE